MMYICFVTLLLLVFVNRLFQLYLTIMLNIGGPPMIRIARADSDGGYRELNTWNERWCFRNTVPFLLDKGKVQKLKRLFYVQADRKC